MGKSITYRALARVLGVALLVLGIGCLIGGNFANGFISSQLSKQEIDIPTDKSLDNQIAKTGLNADVADGLRKWAGQTMSNGDQTHPYAEYIGEHMRLAASTAGYPEVNFKKLAGMISDQKAALTKKVTADNPTMSDEQVAKQVAAESINPLSKYDEALAIQTLTDLRSNTFFMGSMLQGTLLNVWGWSLIGKIATIAGWILVVGGVLLGGAGFWPAKKATPATSTNPQES
ncbi:MAG: hypothetical protein SPI12_00405 [Actinomycetaceae bacterium]|nr:hypothetical protein [Actinomycetaceae bacterium]MDY6082314.1 hypothetical protein [Actinomycetaceae bacterium]